MAILIDPPRWPAHGTLWAHLVSDTSLAELHDFAERCELPRRAFDLDHYDVPAARHSELVAAGAEPVGGHELIRRLRGSGLRVRAAERPARTALALRWSELVPEHPRIGEELAARWSEPHRVYHGVDHLRAVLDRLELLADGGEPVDRETRLAAWFHDAVHRGTSPDDEQASAELATELLAPVTGTGTAEEVARLVRLTATHAPAADDAPGRALCDADLGVLGGDAAEYAAYTAQVRAEYARVPAADFRHGRAQILRRLLERPSVFHTPTGRRLWEAPARANLAREIATLESGG